MTGVVAREALHARGSALDKRDPSPYESAARESGNSPSIAPGRSSLARKLAVLRSTTKEDDSMKFIVPPQKDEEQDRFCPLAHTQCALCSEDPRFCA